jgi:hypothetical protein
MERPVRMVRYPLTPMRRELRNHYKREFRINIRQAIDQLRI